MNNVASFCRRTLSSFGKHEKLTTFGFERVSESDKAKRGTINNERI